MALDNTQKPSFKEGWQNFTGKVSDFNKSEGGKALGQAVAGAAPLITGGNSSTLGNLGMGIGGAVAMVNPMIGAAIMAASALGNAAFGSNVNDAAVSDYEKKILDYSRPDINATDNTGLMNQLSNMETLNVKKSDLGTQGWFSHAVDKKYNSLQQGLSAARASRSRLIDDAVSNVDKMNDARIAANYAAFGGPLYGYIGDGPSSYALAKDNIIVKQMANQDKMKNSFSYIPTYAYGGPTKIHSLVFPRMNEAGEEVAQLEQQARIEAEKARQAKREAAKQARRAQFNRVVNEVKGIFSPTTTTVTTPSEVRTAPKSVVFPALNQPMYIDNYLADGGLLSGNFTNGVTMVDAGGSHGENPFGGVPMGVAPDGQPNLVEEGEVIFNDYVFSKRLKVPKAIRSKYKLRGPKDMTFADAFKYAQEESEERENDPISKNGLNNIAMILMQSQEEVRAKKQRNNSHTAALGGHLFSGLEDPYEIPDVTYSGNDLIVDVPTVTGKKKKKVKDPEAETDALINTFWENVLGGKEYDTPEARRRYLEANDPYYTPYTVKQDPSKGYGLGMNLLRFAEPAANFGAVWSDLAGKTNTPTVFDEIPNYTGINYSPIGEYIEERPMDINYLYNQQRQLAANTVGAIMNTTSPNRFAGLLAADYNNQIASGNLLRDAIIANYDNKIKAKTFNRATNMSNSEMGLKAMTDDVTHRLAYANAKLNQALKNEESSNGAMGAKALNAKALATSVANMGREMDARKDRDLVIGSAGRGMSLEQIKGWISPSKQLEYARGLGYTDKEIADAGIAAYGGKLRKKRRGLTY